MDTESAPTRTPRRSAALVSSGIAVALVVAPPDGWPQPAAMSGLPLLGLIAGGFAGVGKSELGVWRGLPTPSSRPLIDAR